MPSRRDLPFFLIIFILSFIFASDLIIQKHPLQTFDTPAHLTTIAQYRDLIKAGEFPIIWVDKFANYGYPLGLFSHQTIGYFGGFIDIFINNPMTTYAVMILLGSLLSSLFLFSLLKEYFDKETSLLGATFYNFTAYKIINAYIRGALPEYLSVTFFILLLLSIHRVFLRRSAHYFLILILSITLCLLTHPMMCVIYFPIASLYFYFIWKNSEHILKPILIFISTFVFSFLLSAYYLIPLKFENKYFLMGQQTSAIYEEQFLSFVNYFSPEWYYFFSHPGPRGHFIKFGLLESVILVASLWLLLHKNKLKKNRNDFFRFCLISSILLIFLTTNLSSFIYKLPFIREIQYPWRILAPLSVFPPIFLAFITDKYKSKKLFMVVFVTILVARVPQIYTKNVINFPLDRYSFTPYNLHIKDLTLNWIGEPSSYPIKESKVEIIEGEGKITNLQVKNSSRTYEIQAQEPGVRMVDNTFFFPGWRVYVDGQVTNIEYQDPNYRGIITYRVPYGNHQVKVVFENTKIRSYSQLISIVSLIMVPVFYLIYFKKEKS